MQPFRDVFTALFFVSVGMLFDPGFVWSHPGLILAVLGIILVARPLAALLIVLAFRQPARTALTVSVGLAQIGEFSVILGALGKTLGILPQEGFDVLVAGALLSIALNPLLFRAAAALERRLAAGAPPSASSHFDHTPAADGIRPSVIVVGVGDVGRRLCQRLEQERMSLVAVDDDLARLDQCGLHRDRHVFGDPGRPEVLRAAGLENAEVLVLTLSTLPEKMRTCMAAKQLNPRLRIVAGVRTRVRTPSEHAWLQEFGVGWLCDEPGELADGMYRNVVEALSAGKRA
jgi:CPA2 family monovalent cation:H+ antiporter-2